MPRWRQVLPLAVGAAVLPVSTWLLFRLHGRAQLSVGRREAAAAVASGALVCGPGAAAPPGESRLPTIFVSVAAYRDPDANETLHSLYGRAQAPQRVFTGVVCQWDLTAPEELCTPPGMWDALCAGQRWCPQDNLRVRSISYHHAKGPTYARHLASRLYRGEDYFLMIDSHNRFVQDWDAILLAQHNRTGRMKSVLSTYPMALKQDESHSSVNVAYLCALGKMGGWTAGYPGPFWANSFPPSDWPKPSPYVGAGLVFGPGSILRDVPFDPHLPMLFFGEEFLLTARLWTHGYDLYSPGENILYHRYARGGHRPDMAAGVAATVRRSQRRVQHILGITRRGTATQRLVPLDTAEAGVADDLPLYGLGTQRSLWQYWRFARLDPVVQSRQTFEDHWCTTYGPHRGEADGAWRAFARLHDTPTAEWWRNGVAIFSVPPTYRASDYRETRGPRARPTVGALCEDVYPEKCPGWAEAGECKKNPGMLDFCRRSCGQCK